MKDNPEEMFPVVDENGNILDAISRKEAHDGSKPTWKDIQPGKWDTACGGHITLGENVEQALHREVREELGITDFTPHSIGKYVFESSKEKELVYVHRCTYDGVVTPSQDELDGGRFWTEKEIMKNMGKGVFTPNFEKEYQRYFAKQS